MLLVQQTFPSMPRSPSSLFLSNFQTKAMRVHVPLKVWDSSTVKIFICFTRYNICIQGLQKCISHFLSTELVTPMSLLDGSMYDVQTVVHWLWVTICLCYYPWLSVSAKAGCGGLEIWTLPCRARFNMVKWCELSEYCHAVVVVLPGRRYWYSEYRNLKHGITVMRSVWVKDGRCVRNCSVYIKIISVCGFR